MEIRGVKRLAEIQSGSALDRLESVLNESGEDGVRVHGVDYGRGVVHLGVEHDLYHGGSREQMERRRSELRQRVQAAVDTLLAV